MGAHNILTVWLTLYYSTQLLGSFPVSQGFVKPVHELKVNYRVMYGKKGNVCGSLTDGAVMQ